MLDFACMDNTSCIWKVSKTVFIIIITSHNRAPRDCVSASNRQIATTAKCVLPLTHVDHFKSLRTALMLIKTMQPRRANVICVGLHTGKLTRRPRTVSDNDKAASPDLREHSLYVGQRGKHASTHWSRRRACCWSN